MVDKIWGKMNKKTFLLFIMSGVILVIVLLSLLSGNMIKQSNNNSDDKEVVEQNTTKSNKGNWISVSVASIMVLLAVFAGLPSDFGHSGNTNWDEMFADYIHQDVDACFDQILADLLEAIERSVQRNRSKARYVTWAAVLFAVQILGVLFLALVA